MSKVTVYKVFNKKMNKWQLFMYANKKTHYVKTYTSKQAATKAGHTLLERFEANPPESVNSRALQSYLLNSYSKTKRNQVINTITPNTTIGISNKVSYGVNYDNLSLLFNKLAFDVQQKTQTGLIKNAALIKASLSLVSNAGLVANSINKNVFNQQTLDSDQLAKDCYHLLFALQSILQNTNIKIEEVFAKND